MPSFAVGDPVKIRRRQSYRHGQVGRVESFSTYERPSEPGSRMLWVMFDDQIRGCFDPGDLVHAPE